MEPKDQDKKRKQDVQPSICFADGGERHVDWIKYAGDHGKSTNDLIDRAVEHLESIRREGESYTEALARWRAEEEARQQSEAKPDEADDALHP